MKNRDAVRTSILRTTLAALANAEAADAGATHDRYQPGQGVYAGEAQRVELAEDDVVAIVMRERDELLATSRELRQLGQKDKSEDLALKADILDSYLR